jgi:hypothetical protein
MSGASFRTRSRGKAIREDSLSFWIDEESQEEYNAVNFLEGIFMRFGGTTRLVILVMAGAGFVVGRGNRLTRGIGAG